MDVGAGTDGGVHPVLQRPEAAHRPLHSGGHLQVRFRPMRGRLGNRTVKEARSLKRHQEFYTHRNKFVLGDISGVKRPTV